MKNFRSSKNLKPVDPQLKQQCQLRMKVKILQQQVTMLQKSNLNIFIPLSQHPVHEQVDYQSIISKLKTQIVALEHDNSTLRTQIKKLQKSQLQLKQKHHAEITALNNNLFQIKQELSQVSSELQTLNEVHASKCLQCQQITKSLIEKNVQIKFLNHDIEQERAKSSNLALQLKNIKFKISQILNSSLIYKSSQIKCIVLQKNQYDRLKERIRELEQRIREMEERQKREKITVGVRKEDIGEEIVRLKKNIDMQLGGCGDSKHSQEFLKIYKGTKDMFEELIRKCQVTGQ